MQSPVVEFEKNCTQNAYFLQKVDFCIFEPKNREVIEKSSKTPLNFSTLQCTHLGKISFQYHLGLVRKKEIEKWLLRTSVQCIYLLVSSADNFCKQFGLRSGPTKCLTSHPVLSIDREKYSLV